jgi:hypothetical protein
MTGDLFLVVVIAWLFSPSVVRPSGFSSKLTFSPCSLFPQISLSLCPTTKTKPTADKPNRFYCFFWLVSQLQPSQEIKASTNPFGTTSFEPTLKVTKKCDLSKKDEVRRLEEPIDANLTAQGYGFYGLKKHTAKLQLLRQDIIEKEESTNG